MTSNRNKKGIIKRILEFLFGKTITISDSFFGEMTDAGNYYECRRSFRPTQQIVEIGLEKKAPADEKQVRFLEPVGDLYLM